MKLKLCNTVNKLKKKNLEKRGKKVDKLYMFNLDGRNLDVISVGCCFGFRGLFSVVGVYSGEFCTLYTSI